MALIDLFGRGTMIDWIGAIAITLLLIAFALYCVRIGALRADPRDARKEASGTAARPTGTAPETTKRRPGPLKLTDLGRRVAEHMALEAWAAETSKPFRIDVQSLEPWRVDELARSYITGRDLDGAKTERMTTDIAKLHDRVSETAYTFGLTRTDVTGVMRVVLRDRLLALKAATAPTTDDDNPDTPA